MSSLISCFPTPIQRAYHIYRGNKIFERKSPQGEYEKLQKLSREQIKELDDFYGRYGINVWRSYGYYRLLSSAHNIFSPEYMDNITMDTEILPRLNNIKLSYAYEDKSYLDKIVGRENAPYTFLRNINGFFYDHDFNHITTAEAVLLFKKENESEVIVKPSLGSWAGHRVRKYAPGVDVTGIFEDYGINFIAQRVIKQHNVLFAFNPTSVNTLRIISFYYKQKTHILLSSLRCGRAGSYVDNLGAGGVCYPVSEQGVVEQGPCSKHGWPTTHHYNEKLAARPVKIPNYDAIKTFIEKHHPNLPHFSLIAWDFAVGVDGMPVVVEFNVFGISIETQQAVSHMPFFGDMTEEFLKYAMSRPKLFKWSPYVRGLGK